METANLIIGIIVLAIVLAILWMCWPEKEEKEEPKLHWSLSDNWLSYYRCPETGKWYPQQQHYENDGICPVCGHVCTNLSHGNREAIKILECYRYELGMLDVYRNVREIHYITKEDLDAVDNDLDKLIAAKENGEVN